MGQDEAGVAAYKTVELDDLLGDAPVIYREVQGNESQLFLELFPKLVILDGGIESGFRRVKKKTARPRLFLIHGFQKNVQEIEVAIKVESLNDYDAYVLDAGDKIWQFHGSNATVWEKRRANMVTIDLIAQRFGRSKCVEIITGADDDSPEFWAFFGGKPDKIRSEHHVQKKRPPKRMLRVSDAKGEMEVTVEVEGRLDAGLLDTGADDIFICDNGMAIYIWVGRGSNPAERKHCMVACVDYLNKHGRDLNVPIVRVLEGKEPNHFLRAIGRKGNSDSYRPRMSLGR